LHVARVISLTAHGAKSRAVDVGGDSAEYCTVEEVKRIRLNSESQFFENLEILPDRYVLVEIPGIAEAKSHRARCGTKGVRSRILESCLVDELLAGIGF